MILRAKANGNIEIEKNIYKNKRGEDKLEYILKNLKSSRLDTGERKLFETLFSLGDGDSISTRQMDKLRRTEADNYNKKFNDFIYFLEDEMMKKKTLHKRKKYPKDFYILCDFFNFIFCGSRNSLQRKIFWNCKHILLTILLRILNKILLQDDRAWKQKI